MRTATRWTTLVKLPVALSGGSSENCDPRRERPKSRRLRSRGRRANRWRRRLSGRGGSSELGLLKIGVDIGAGQRNQRQQTRARLDILAKLRRPLPTTPSNGATIVVKERSRSALARAVSSSPRVRPLRFLRRQNVEIGARAFSAPPRSADAGAGASQRRRGSGAIGGGLFKALLRPKLVCGEFLRAIVFERGALRRPRRSPTAPAAASTWACGLGDDAACALDLPADARDRRVLGRDFTRAEATAS